MEFSEANNLAGWFEVGLRTAKIFVKPVSETRGLPGELDFHYPTKSSTKRYLLISRVTRTLLGHTNL